MGTCSESIRLDPEKAGTSPEIWRLGLKPQAAAGSYGCRRTSQRSVQKRYKFTDPLALSCHLKQLDAIAPMAPPGNNVSYRYHPANVFRVYGFRWS
jgi:hypothetical protein